MDWVPGVEDYLNENQLKQAFYDYMPPTWRERFVQAGHSSRAMTLAQVLHYFRQQESLTEREQAENDRLQQRAKIVNRRLTIKQNHPSMNLLLKSNVSQTIHLVQFSHPDMGHVWGKCRALTNKYMQQSDQQMTDDKKKEFKKPNSTKTSDHFAVDLSPDNEKKDDEISTNDTSIMNEDVDPEGKSSAVKMLKNL
jgi:hypothetical protein